MQYQFQQPVHGFVYVAGIEGAKAYQMPPSSEMPLFDSTTDGVMYVKVTDAAGYPTITTVDCSPREEPTAEPTVTRDDLNRIYSDLSAQVEQLKGAINGLVPKSAVTAVSGNVVPSGGEGQPAAGGYAADAVRPEVRPVYEQQPRQEPAADTQRVYGR